LDIYLQCSSEHGDGAIGVFDWEEERQRETEGFRETFTRFGELDDTEVLWYHRVF